MASLKYPFYFTKNKRYYLDMTNVLCYSIVLPILLVFININSDIKGIIISISTSYIVSFVIYYVTTHNPMCQKEFATVTNLAFLVKMIDSSIEEVIARQHGTDINELFRVFLFKIKSTTAYDMASLPDDASNVRLALADINGNAEFHCQANGTYNQSSAIALALQMRAQIDKLKNHHADGEELIRCIQFGMENYPLLLRSEHI